MLIYLPLTFEEDFAPYVGYIIQVEKIFLVNYFFFLRDMINRIINQMGSNFFKYILAFKLNIF